MDQDSCYFNGQIKVLSEKNFKKLGVSKDQYISTAKDLIPEDFDSDGNIDLMPVVFNLAVINEFNKNGDGTDAKTAASFLKRFANKPVNIEHKKQKIVGHIINASFSKEKFDFQENDIEQFLEDDEPFYLNASALIYKHIFPNLAEAIVDAADPDSENYGDVSTSWEVAFFDYAVARGSNILKDCEIMRGSDAEKYEEDLLVKGGSGFDVVGTPVNRLIEGDVFPLGAGITYTPAARVKGIHTAESLEEYANSRYNKQKDNESKAEKISLKHENNVKKEKSNIFSMTKQEFDELTKKVKEAVASETDQTEQVKGIAQIMTETLAENSKSWESKVEKAKAEKEKAEKDLETIKSSLESTKKEIETLKKESQAKAAAELFNERMSFVDENYEFQKDELDIVVAELKAVGESDQDFDSFKTKIDTLFSHRNKETIASLEEAKEKEIEAAVAKRLEEGGDKSKTKEKLKTKNEDKNKIPNGSSKASENKTLFERVEENFEVEIS